VIITKNNIQSLVENWTLEVLSEENSPIQKLDEIWPLKSKSKKEEPGEDAAAEEETATKYPFMKDFLKNGDASVLKQNKQEVLNLVAELVSGIGMSLSDLADRDRKIKKEQERREREQRSNPGQSRPEQELKLGDTVNDKGEEVDPGEASAIDKDAPLSVMRKQKNIKTGDGATEETIVGKLEKMIPGLGQSGAQFLAKSIASYLKKRGLPVAEANILSTAKILLTEAGENIPTLQQALQQSADKKRRDAEAAEEKADIPDVPDASGPKTASTDVPELGGPQGLGTLNKDLKRQERSKYLDPKSDDTKPDTAAPTPAADDKEPSAEDPKKPAPETNSNLSPAEKQARSGRVKSFTAGIRRNLSKNLAGDPKKQKKFLYKVQNLAKQGREGLEQLNQNLGSQLNDDEIASASANLQKWASNALSTWGKEGHASGDSFRDLQANMQTNIKNIKDVAKGLDPIGKVIARSLASNYGNAAKNPGLAQLLSDPKGIAGISASIKQLLQKQLQLRGKDTADIKNLMEHLTIVMDRLLKEGNNMGGFEPGDLVKIFRGDIPPELKSSLGGSVIGDVTADSRTEGLIQVSWRMHDGTRLSRDWSTMNLKKFERLKPM
jgi:hypothetical protein